MISNIKKCEEFARAKGLFVDGFLDSGSLVIYVVPEDEVYADMDIRGMQALLGPNGQIIVCKHGDGDEASVFDLEENSGAMMMICGFSQVPNVLEVQRTFNPEHTILVVDEGLPGFINRSAKANLLADVLSVGYVYTDVLSVGYV